MTLIRRAMDIIVRSKVEAGDIELVNVASVDRLFSMVWVVAYIQCR